MTTGNSNSAESIAALLQNRFRNVASRGSVNEATTISLLIQPVLEALGYPAEYRVPEHGEGRQSLGRFLLLDAGDRQPRLRRRHSRSQSPRHRFRPRPVQPGQIRFPRPADSTLSEAAPGQRPRYPGSADRRGQVAHLPAQGQPDQPGHRVPGGV